MLDEHITSPTGQHWLTYRAIRSGSSGAQTFSRGHAAVWIGRTWPACSWLTWRGWRHSLPKALVVLTEGTREYSVRAALAAGSGNGVVY